MKYRVCWKLRSEPSVSGAYERLLSDEFDAQDWIPRFNAWWPERQHYLERVKPEKGRREA